MMHSFNRAVEETTLEALKGEIGHYAPPNESLVALNESRSSHSTIVPQQLTVPQLLSAEDNVSPKKADNGYMLCGEDSTKT